MAVHKFVCGDCERQFEVAFVEISDEPPACPYCGGLDLQLLGELETREAGVTSRAASTEPIIVGVDGSAASLAGLERAATLCIATAVSLIAVHVRHVPAAAAAFFASADLACTVDECEEEARRLTAEALAPYKVDWRFEVREGDPGRELVDAAKAHHAQAILVGAARHPAVVGELVGSVSCYLLHHAPQSVMVVRPLQRSVEAADPVIAAAAPR
jgi:nucleotide-binding universal stress UspA family protein